MNERLNKSLLFMEKNWHMPDSVFERVSHPCMSAIRTIFLMAHQFSRTESRVWNADLLWRSIYHALLLIDFTCFDKILFCGPGSNPHCIIPGLRKGGGKEKKSEVIFAWQEDSGLGRGLVVGVGVLIVGVNHSLPSNLPLSLRLDRGILVYIQIAFGIT